MKIYVQLFHIKGNESNLCIVLNVELTTGALGKGSIFRRKVQEDFATLHLHKYQYFVESPLALVAMLPSKDANQTQN